MPGFPMPSPLKFSVGAGGWEALKESFDRINLTGYRYKDMRVRVGRPDRYLFFIEFDTADQATIAKLTEFYGD